jgi:hypothetical protein
MLERLESRIAKRVLKYIDCEEDYLTVCLVCKAWGDLIRSTGIRKKVFNRKLMIIIKFSHSSWDYDMMSRYGRLTEKFIMNNIDKLNIQKLSENYRLPISVVLKHPNLGWNIQQIAYRTDSLEFFRQFRDVINFDWISIGSKVTPDLMLESLDLPWNYNEYCRSGSTIYENIRKYPKFPWNYDIIASTIGITTDKLHEYISLGYSYVDVELDRFRALGHGYRTSNSHVLGYPGIPLDVIQECINTYQIQYISGITEGSLITWEFITNNPDVAWEVYDVIRIITADPAYNEYETYEETVEFVIHHSWHSIFKYNRPVDNLRYDTLEHISEVVRLEYILKHISYEWDWKIIARRKDLTWDIVMKHEIHKLARGSLIRNPNVTWTIVRDHPEIRWGFQSMFGY